MDWNEIYKKHGILQKNILPCVTVAASKLEDLKLSEPQVLDAGCGTGRHVRFIRIRLPDAKVSCFDISPEGLAYIENDERIDKRVLDMNSGVLPYQNNSFDLAISTLVIEHGVMKQIKRNVEELKRVVKNNGLIAFAVPSTQDFRYGQGKKLEEGTYVYGPQLDGTIPHHFFTDNEIKELFFGCDRMFKRHFRRKSVTASGQASNLEYVFKVNK